MVTCSPAWMFRMHSARCRVWMLLAPQAFFTQSMRLLGFGAEFFMRGACGSCQRPHPAAAWKVMERHTNSQSGRLNRSAPLRSAAEVAREQRPSASGQLRPGQYRSDDQISSRNAHFAACIRTRALAASVKILVSRICFRDAARQVQSFLSFQSSMRGSAICFWQSSEG